MATFQKPENALKRAEELIEVGKVQDALDTLHATMQNRKFKNMWTTCIEQIMVRHLELCVQLKKMRTAREGLYQYRTMCQATNIGSLELVVQKFRKAAEQKVHEAKAQQDSDLAGVEDLDEQEAPHSILLRAIQAHDTRQQSQDRDLHMHFRFLWDTYKVILDVLKSNVRLEEVYHETAKHAFEFCRVNKRPAEFKRLCETLRKNWQDLQKHTGKVPVHQVDPRNADTISRTLETRCSQLRICTELDLWRESYLTATEIYELMSKARPKPNLRSMYYEYLGKIFWKSDNHLFHAFACLKNLQFVKAAKSNITKEELQVLASRAVLATLCVPFQRNSDIHATLELTTEGASSPYEKAKKHAQLFNVASVPTRETISQNLVEKTLLPLAAEPVRRLFDLIQSDFTPLSLCQDAKPYLDEIAKGELFDGQLVSYITPLKQIIFFRLMKQLSEVYSNMTIDNFEAAASIVPFSIAEKWMANAARHHGINIQINYSHKTIVFGAPRKMDMKSMRQPLIEIGHKLQQAMQRVAPEEQHKKEKLEKQQISQNIVRRIEEETKLIRQRKDEIERRKEESERRKDIEEQKMIVAQRKQEMQEAAAERERQEKERIQRHREREEQLKKEAELLKNKEMLEEMKKQADMTKTSNLKIEGKKLIDIDIDDMAGFDPNKIIAAREAQRQRERQEKIRLRKLESKRVDHLARALREEEQEYLEEWADDIVAEDEAYVEKAQGKEIEEQRVKHEEGLQERATLISYKAPTDVWAQGLLEARRAAHKEAEREREKRCLQKAIDLKIQRARQRAKEAAASEAEKKKMKRERDEAETKKKEQEEEEEERRQMEEERSRRQEEEDEDRRVTEEQEKEERALRTEQRRKDREADQEKLNQQTDRQRQKEVEIEARQKSEAEERSSARAAPRKEEPRKEEPKDDDDGDNWRSVRKAPARDDKRDDKREDKRDDKRDDKGGDDWRSGPRSAAPTRDEAPSERPKPAWAKPREEKGRDEGGDDWRSAQRSAPTRDEAPSERPKPAWAKPREDKGRDEGGDKGGDDWRSGPRSAPTRDDRDDPKTRAGGDREGWRSKGRDEEEDRSGSAWGKAGDRDPLRRAEPEAPAPAKSAWGRGPPGGDAAPAAKREEPAKKEATAAAKREEPPARKKEDPPPVADEEGEGEEADGWAVATKSKKASGKKPGDAGPALAAAGGAGDRHPTPPWKRRKDP